MLKYKFAVINTYHQNYNYYEVDQHGLLWFYKLTSRVFIVIVNISEAKTNLSKLVDLVIHKPSGVRKLGLLINKFKTPDDFLDEDMEIKYKF